MSSTTSAIVILMMLGNFHTAHAATIYESELAQGYYKVTIEGEITREDPFEFKNLTKTIMARADKIWVVDLFAPAGHEEAGMEIGREIRKIGAKTNAPLVQNGKVASCFPASGEVFGDVFDSLANPNCNCKSACGLAWLGGVERFGSFGIEDRGGSNSQNDELPEDDNIFAPNAVVVSYLEEIEVPQKVIGAFLADTSDFPIFLHAQRDGLVHDPAYANYITSRCGPYPSAHDLNNTDDARHAELLLKEAKGEPVTDCEQNELRLLNNIRHVYEICQERAHQTSIYRDQ